MRAVRPTPHNLPAAEINAPRLDPAQVAARLSIPRSIHAPPPGSSPGTQPSVHEAKTTPGTVAAPGSSPGAVTAPGSSPGRVAAGSSPGTVAASGGPPVPLHPSIRLGAPVGTIEDSILDRLDAVLREFPEVEFACVGSAGGVNAFGLRIDARMRRRLDALGEGLGRVSPPGAHFYLLDDPDHFRAARAEALVFFPWRRR
jgi:hypothetical protein